MKIDLTRAFRNDFIPEGDVIDPQLVFEDDNLSSTQLFKKYVPRIFPFKIGNQIMELYPDLRCDKHKKIRKLANQSLIILGKAGTGKSFMSCMLALFGRVNSWYYLSFHVKFITVPDLLMDLRTLVINGNTEITETGRTAYAEYIFKLKAYRFLILDDLGTEKSTDFANSILDSVIDARYQKAKARHTIITTNLSLKELEENRGHARILSRINDVGSIVELTHRYRKTKININRV